MSFVWKTNYIGYPNFFSGNTAAHQLGDFYRLIAEAAGRGVSYSEFKLEAKSNFGVSAHQSETKKAAFQEFGITYVVPRSDTISITPAGDQLSDLAGTPAEADKERRRVLLLLARSLARHQFQNPFPAGARKAWADSSDVLPYLAVYYLFMKLGGLITVSELFGAVFGLREMRFLPDLAAKILNQRKRRTPFARLPGLPESSKTRDNLKIYLMAHAGLDWEILTGERVNFYGFEEQCYELSGFGSELIGTVLNTEWPKWKVSREAPTVRAYGSVLEYFHEGVGTRCPDSVFEKDAKLEESVAVKISKGPLSPEDFDSLRELPKRSFIEGRKKLVTHARAERNRSLVREAKRQFRDLHGRLYCEACGFEFLLHYGERGRDFIEAHHRKPISTLTGAVATKVEDLEMVCANCHRMLHRPPWISVQELRDSLG